MLLIMWKINRDIFALRASATIIFRMYIMRSMLFCHSPPFLRLSLAVTTEAGAVHVTRFFYRVHVIVSLPFIYWKSFPENAGEHSGCEDVAGIVMILLTDAASRTAVHRVYVRTYIYIYILVRTVREEEAEELILHAGKTVIFLDENTRMGCCDVLLQPHVYISLQRDGDILLQARGDLDKKFAKDEVPLSIFHL